MQTAFIQTVVLFVFVLIALQKEAKSVVQMAERTNTRVNLRSMPARKTRAFQSFHRVDVKVCWKQFMSIILVSSFLFLKGIPTLSLNRLSLGPRRRWLWRHISSIQLNSWAYRFSQNSTLVPDLIKSTAKPFCVCFVFFLINHYISCLLFSLEDSSDERKSRKTG